MNTRRTISSLKKEEGSRSPPQRRRVNESSKRRRSRRKCAYIIYRRRPPASQAPDTEKLIGLEFVVGRLVFGLVLGHKSVGLGRRVLGEEARSLYGGSVEGRGAEDAGWVREALVEELVLLEAVEAVGLAR